MEKFRLVLAYRLFDLAQNLGQWILCKIDRPVFSPGALQLYSIVICPNCGKCHGDLIEKQKELNN